LFSITERDRLRALLISSARTDERITGIALTGSASTGTEDRWSDIDLAFGFAAGTELAAAIGDWTAVMYADHGAVHHLDIISGATTYRVFLLACLRYGLPARQGRGMDRLPAEVTGPLAGALVRGLDVAELKRAFGVATQALLTEIGQVDAALAARLSSTLRELARAMLRRLQGLPGVTGAEKSGTNGVVGLLLSRGLTAFAGRRRSDVTLRGI
jgi:hypothetical protein